jgi:quinol monooxygenase YgiN
MREVDGYATPSAHRPRAPPRRPDQREWSTKEHHDHHLEGAPLVTFINVFTVEPVNQQRLVDLLARFTDASVRHAPGFVSAALHRSLDGAKVTMYSQWRTIEDCSLYWHKRAFKKHLRPSAGGAVEPPYEPGQAFSRAPSGEVA